MISILGIFLIVISLNPAYVSSWYMYPSEHLLTDKYLRPRQDIGEPYEELENGNMTLKNSPYLYNNQTTSIQETLPARNCQHSDKMRCHFPQIEAMVRQMKEGCVHISLASLTPFNRGVSLFARSRFCVTAGA